MRSSTAKRENRRSNGDSNERVWDEERVEGGGRKIRECGDP